MPNSRDSRKRDRQSKSVRLHNRSSKSAVRTVVKKFEYDLDEGKVSPENLRLVIKNLDTASRKGLIKKNAAARKKSRLMKRVNKLGKV
ncbi:30S ribosomal protein S20 [Entomospira culicis]|uniref:Small ribosomal subunit protein bS20 n=1 Tax=Entomospira culicis TaxID=2719989 RepID=A0A968KUC1_9SPIO|nr:30S ribosomal protein S20 [Entomospira culicis]NIZ18760.1 30S ribosomal protein S20 [Entomospira culicis]NIZ68975.1 30S ribosomal protein S20 [Entomospira culicis]WDI37566.1 30S ribosomal protein S20 [Entomospira culicis]WDI39194.1 30S ribosomal protein S20 [Entomospira culicis]